MHTTINRIPFNVEPEPADYWRWIRDGCYDHEWQAYDWALKPDHTFIDLGAWVGAHSLYASKKAVRVVAVEPDPVAVEIAKKNLAGMEVRQLAISGHCGELKLGSGLLGASTTRTNPNAGGRIGPWDEKETCVVPCETIWKFCEPIEGKLFIKCDVEGSEEEIVKDLHFFSERRPTVLMELHPFWWKYEQMTWADFEAVKALYRNPREIPHANSNTWILSD